MSVATYRTAKYGGTNPRFQTVASPGSGVWTLFWLLDSALISAGWTSNFTSSTFQVATGAITGTFTAGETITGGTSGATQVVATSTSTSPVNLTNSSPSTTNVIPFTAGETITGGSSGAHATVNAAPQPTFSGDNSYLSTGESGTESMYLHLKTAGLGSGGNIANGSYVLAALCQYIDGSNNQWNELGGVRTATTGAGLQNSTSDLEFEASLIWDYAIVIDKNSVAVWTLPTTSHTTVPYSMQCGIIQRPNGSPSNFTTTAGYTFLSATDFNVQFSVSGNPIAAGYQIGDIVDIVPQQGAPSGVSIAYTARSGSTWVVGETITGGTSGATGIVVAATMDGTVNYSASSGTFTAGDPCGTNATTPIAYVRCKTTNAASNSPISVTMGLGTTAIASGVSLTDNTSGATRTTSSAFTNGTTGTLMLIAVNGTFTNGETLTGGTSGGTATGGAPSTNTGVSLAYNTYNNYVTTNNPAGQSWLPGEAIYGNSTMAMGYLQGYQDSGGTGVLSLLPATGGFSATEKIIGSQVVANVQDAATNTGVGSSLLTYRQGAKIVALTTSTITVDRLDAMCGAHNSISSGCLIGEDPQPYYCTPRQGTTVWPYYVPGGSTSGQLWMTSPMAGTNLSKQGPWVYNAAPSGSNSGSSFNNSWVLQVTPAGLGGYTNTALTGNAQTLPPYCNSSVSGSSFGNALDSHVETSPPDNKRTSSLWIATCSIIDSAFQAGTGVNGMHGRLLSGLYRSARSGTFATVPTYSNLHANTGSAVEYVAVWATTQELWMGPFPNLNSLTTPNITPVTTDANEIQAVVVPSPDAGPSAVGDFDFDAYMDLLYANDRLNTATGTGTGGGEPNKFNMGFN